MLMTIFNLNNNKIYNYINIFFAFIINDNIIKILF